MARAVGKDALGRRLVLLDRLLLLDLVDLDPDVVALEVLLAPSSLQSAMHRERGGRERGARTELKAKRSPGLTSRPLGCLVKTRTLPHARLCSVRESSLASAAGRCVRFTSLLTRRPRATERGMQARQLTELRRRANVLNAEHPLVASVSLPGRVVKQEQHDRLRETDEQLLPPSRPRPRPRALPPLPVPLPSAPSRKHGPERHRVEPVRPSERPPAVFPDVERPEPLPRVDHRPRERDGEGRVRGPVALGEDRYAQVEGVPARGGRRREGAHDVGREIHVLEHDLELLREAGTALWLVVSRRRRVGCDHGEEMRAGRTGQVSPTPSQKRETTTDAPSLSLSNMLLSASTDALLLSNSRLARSRL